MPTPQSLIDALWPGAWENDIAQAPLVPCKIKDKVPLVAWKNYQDTPPKISQIKKWEAEYPGCNWALLTGEPSGIVVLDMDNYDMAMAWLRQAMLDEPKTIMVQTSAKQYHYYLKWPGRTCSNFAKKIPGFDFRGDGGYVIAPGSLHPKGHRYQWVQGYDPSMQELAPCPDWLLLELFGEKVNPLPISAEAHDNVFCTISVLGQDIDIPMSEYEKRLIDALAAGVAKGSRNQSGFCIGIYLLDIGVSFNDMRLALLSWNYRCNPPMGEKEINALPLNIQKYWDRKKHQKKYQRECISRDGRDRGIEELSSFLGIDIVDVYQTPDEERTITILAKKDGQIKTAVHKKITGFRSWAADFSQQTLIVPTLPEKITNQFSNEFILLLYSVARVRELLEGGTKISQVQQAMRQMIENGIAKTKDDSAIYRDRRGVSCFGAYEDGENVVFHIFQFKDCLAQVTTDLITDRELAKILTDIDCQLKTIHVHDRRARAWHVKKSLYI